jgi:hypothetical protein
VTAVLMWAAWAFVRVATLAGCVVVVWRSVREFDEDVRPDRLKMDLPNKPGRRNRKVGW